MTPQVKFDLNVQQGFFKFEIGGDILIFLICRPDLSKNKSYAAALSQAEILQILYGKSPDSA